MSGPFVGIGMGITRGASIGVSGVVPPLDGLAASVQGYSTRLLRTAYLGDCVRLRRDSDNAELDFGFDLNGDIDATAISTWLAGADGYLVTWYDQSGNGFDVTQAAAARQPFYLASGIDGKPSFRMLSFEYLAYSGVAWTDEPVEFISVGKPTNVTSLSTVFSNHRSSASLDFTSLVYRTGTICWATKAGGTTRNEGVKSGLVVGTPALVGGRFVSDTSRFARINGVDGVENTANQPDVAFDEFLVGRLRTVSGTSEHFFGELSELVLWNSVLSAGNRLAIEANMNANWSLF